MNALRCKNALAHGWMIISPHARHAVMLAMLAVSGGFVSGALLPPRNAVAACFVAADRAAISSAGGNGGGPVAQAIDRVLEWLVASEARQLCAWQALSDRAEISRISDVGTIGALLGVLLSAGTAALRLSNPRWRLQRRHGALATLWAARRWDEAARYKHCFEQAADGMMLVEVETNGRFVYAEMNPAWQRMCGQPAGPSLRRQPHDVWPGPVADAVVARFRRCVASGQNLQYADTDFETATRDLRIVMTPIREPAPAGAGAGRISLLLCQARDMTEQNQLEARLQHEQRMETIRRLSAGVAHDFNNILQAICGGLELILDEVKGTGATRELATIALVAAQRGSHLTQHLLAYARRQVLSPRPVNLREFLPQLRPALEQAIGPDNRLELAFGYDVGSVFVDEENLRTALLNLARNAGRAMPDGGWLRIETEASHDPRGAVQYVRIIVTDTGIGMDEATLARCPEPFFTTKGSTGTGLGLSMVQGFAIQSGGALRLASHLGQGTSAVLTLPACSTEERAAPRVAENDGAERGGAGRVLLVDDATDVLLTTGRMLQQAGLDVVPVTSGDAALALLAGGQRFEFLVTDYAMPGLSGTELIRLAREMQPALPALIITGLYEVDISRLRETGLVLRKPFQRQELLNALRDLHAPQPEIMLQE